jgi:putative oxidoreductase
MSTVIKMEHWADQHHPKWLEYLRILLGLILISKGIAYVVNKEQVINMIESSQYWVVHYAIAHYVIGGYIACGLAIAIGLFTRVAVMFEIPALLGSMFFLDLHKNLFALNSQIIYSVLIFALLLFFLLYGPGTLSFDYYIQKHTDKNYDLR